jgi:pimeloyl-ACP methyl ester carboxylesterase
MNELKTHTLGVAGTVLHYDVRSNDGSIEPVLLLIGSPMTAEKFGTLAGYFTDRTVVTFDPRGAGRSKRTDGAVESTPEEHADDLYRLISALDAGPVDIFASSGGAVNALALVATHPEQVRTLVAHEPPASAELPDREAVLAVCRDIQQRYQRGGFGPAMAKFIALVSHAGPVPNGFADLPAPDPALMGLPTADDGTRDDPLLQQNIVTCHAYRQDFEALRAAPTRIVIGASKKSAQMILGRAAVIVAERLGTTPVTFPDGHEGFIGGVNGQARQAAAFAATLRKVLAG